MVTVDLDTRCIHDMVKSTCSWCNKTEPRPKFTEAASGPFKASKTAEYRSLCNDPECLDTIRIGDPIHYLDGTGWVCDGDHHTAG